MAKAKIGDVDKKVDKGSGEVEKTTSFTYGGKDYSETTSNLELQTLTPEEVRIALNKAPAKFAYWSGFQQRCKKEMSQLQLEYDLWFATCYRSLADPKMTETAKKQAVMLDNVKEYKAWQTKIHDLQFCIDQLSVLSKSYDMQSRTLQSIGGLLKSEMENLE
jgi:hypothetical protein